MPERRTMGTHIAPIQLLAVSFDPEARYEGQILEVLDDIEERGSLRVLDVFLVRKASDGSLITLGAQSERLSGVVATALGVAEAGISLGRPLGVTEIEEVGAALEPGEGVGMALVEHVWAAELTDAIAGAHGRLLTSEFLGDESLAAVAATLTEPVGDGAGQGGNREEPSS